MLKHRHVPHTAFTIIELLVVMMIVVTLMSLGVGAWIGAAQTSETVATQQMIYGLIQQARNRSISSGEPVVLHINKDEGSISGIHKDYLWYKKNVWTYIPPPPPLVALPPASPGAYLPLFMDDQGGFVLRCRINAPPAGTAGQNIIPLLLLTESGNDNNISNAFGGLELWRVPQFVDHDGNKVRVSETWAIVGWLGTDRPTYPSDPSLFSDWNNYVAGNKFVREWNYDDSSGKRFNMKPYTGDRWITVEMVYDNASLHLYRDGIKVDYYSAESGALNFTPVVNQAVDIYAASHQRGAPVTEFFSTADIKDGALLQVGTGDAEYLPGGIRPLEHYKVLCADSVINCFKEDGTPTDTLIFVDGDGTGADNFEISIGPDGSIMKNKIYTYEEITEE